jgi:MtaA/CmuA family methyltransferase
VTPLERFRRRLAGQPVDRVPNFDIFMTFAAHHIGAPLSRYYLDHRVLVEANLAVQRDFGIDIVQAISDPYREAHDLGLKVDFPEDGLPVRREGPLEDPSRLAQLRPIDPAQGRRMSDRLEAIRRLRDEVGGQVPVMGWVEGAFAEAGALRGHTRLLVDVVDRPEWVEDLLERCVEVEIAFAQAQVEAGADLIGLGDAIASQVSRRMYERFALPYERRIFEAVHQKGALARLHICGDTSHLVELMPRTGADVIDIDWMVDVGAAATAFGPGIALCGNFDPVEVMLRGTPEAAFRATRRCIEQGGPRHISAAGCEIPDKTPPENLRAQARALREAVA